MKIAIVTGASSGLGREFVRQLARRMPQCGHSGFERQRPGPSRVHPRPRLPDPPHRGQVHSLPDHDGDLGHFKKDLTGEFFLPRAHAAGWAKKFRYFQSYSTCSCTFSHAMVKFFRVMEA